MDRRFFLAASVVTASGLALRAAAAATEGPFGATATPVPVPPAQGLRLGPLPSTRYPDTDVEALDKRFKGSVGTGAVERVSTGFRWAEGPTYFRAGHYLLFSSAPNDVIGGGYAAAFCGPARVQFQGRSSSIRLAG
jgi:gluconolactonase